MVRASADDEADAGEALGQRLASELLAMGAGEFL
jgi:hypothetical protein